MKAPTRLALAISFTAICLIWGSTWLAIKEGLQTVPPFLSAATRFALAAVFLRLVMWQQRESIPRTPAYWGLILETGLLTYAAPFALIYWGQRQIPSALSAVLFATYPFFVAIASRLRIPGERLSWVTVFGIVLGFSGVTVIFSDELFSEGSLSPLGMGAIILSAALQAYALISVRKKGRDVHPATLTFGGMIIGGLCLTAATLAFEDPRSAEFTSTAVLSILYLAAFGTTITFVTYFWLVKHVNPVLLALTAFITPIIALILGSIVLDEHLGRYAAVGAVLVLGGVLTANATGIRKFIADRLIKTAA